MYQDVDYVIQKSALSYGESELKDIDTEREHFCNAYFDDFELFAAILR